MRTVNPANPPKPCDYFDLIGGTSTGGLIAIMLGRLKMDIDDCITAYLQISQDVFQPRKKKINFLGRANDALKVRGRFDSEALKRGIQKIVVQSSENGEAKLKIEAVPKCRVFVCATRGEMGMHTALLRSYESKRPNEVDCTIWEAGRATSAASSFFDPIKIGHFDETFVDGGTGCNNPIEKVFEEALGIWGESARERISCFVSIGTGQPTERGFGKGLKEIASTLINISTETEQTAVRFSRVHTPFIGSSSMSRNTYFRFNVAKGLEEIGLERHEDKAKIAAATKVYLSNPQTSDDLIACAGVLKNQFAVEVNKTVCEPTFSEDTVTDCLRSLAFPEMDARLHGIETAANSTCEWIFETSQFRNWTSRVNIASHNGVLWIKGKPGAGKSTLMKKILSHFQGSSQEFLIASYFFHGRGNNQLQKSPLGMMRSIVYQLLDQNSTLCEAFLPLFLDKQKKHGEAITWYLGELQSFLLSSIGRLRLNPTLLLVDALDECVDDEAQLIVAFLESLACTAVDSDNALSVFLASRHYPQIRIKKADELIVEAQGEHEKDIIDYVRQNLIDNDQEIMDELLRKSAHVFLWVELVVKMLNQAYIDGRIRAMKNILDQLPMGLDNLYAELLTKGRNQDDIQESVCMFQWVLFAKDEMGPEKLYFAVLAGMNPDQLKPWDREKESLAVIQRYITSMSRGLIEARPSGDHYTPNEQEFSDWSSDRSGGVDKFVYVQFIHESVKDFLVSVKGLPSLDTSLSRQLIGKSHSRLADCCLSYIMMNSLDPLEEQDLPRESWNGISKQHPFLHYAEIYLLDHLEQALVSGVPQLEMLSRLQQGSKPVLRLQICARRSQNFTWDDKAEVIHAAARNGHYQIVRSLLDEMNVDVNTAGGYCGSALQAAALEGHKRVVKLCIDRGADVNAIGGCWGTALQAAAASGYEKIVQLCIDRGADVNGKGGNHFTALHAAVLGGFKSTASILLKHGADVNARGGGKGTVLREARSRFHTSALMRDLLLQYGAEDHPPMEESEEGAHSGEEKDSEDDDAEAQYSGLD